MELFEQAPRGHQDRTAGTSIRDRNKQQAGEYRIEVGTHTEDTGGIG